METLNFAHIPSTAHIALFTSVKNPQVLRNRIIKASTAEGPDGGHERAALNFAFIDATMITSREHLMTAIHQATLSLAHDALRTRTVHSEVLWALSPSANITDAIRRYGVSDKSTALIVVRIISPHAKDTYKPGHAEIREDMCRAVDGELVSLGELKGITDWRGVCKQYKFQSEDQSLVDAVAISTVAMKSVMS